MFLARIDGTLTAARKHDLLNAARFLIAQRLEPDGRETGEPIVVIDRMGAGRGSVVMVSSDGTITRDMFGARVPARLVVAGIVDRVSPQQPTGEKAS